MKWNRLWNFNNWLPPPTIKPIKPVKIPVIRPYYSSEGGYLQRAQIGWKPKPPEKGTSYAFITWLEKKGFKVLGTGAYSTVLWKKGDRVIKVIRSQDNWIDYCKWAAELGYAGRMAPRVYSWKRIGDFSIASMEKIEYTANSVNYKEDKYMHSSLLSTFLHSSNNLAGDLLDQLVPGAKAFSNDLLSRWEYLDIHHGNIMFRADGSLVVVDPVCGKSRLGVKRLRAGDFGLSPAH